MTTTFRIKILLLMLCFGHSSQNDLYDSECSVTCVTTGEYFQGYRKSDTWGNLTKCDPLNECRFATNHENEAALLILDFKILIAGNISITEIRLDAISYDLSSILREENLAESEISDQIFHFTFVGLKVLSLETISESLDTTISGTVLNIQARSGDFGQTSLRVTALYGMANDGSNVALSQSERERLNVRHRVAISLKNTKKLDKYDVLAVPVERQIFSRYTTVSYWTNWKFEKCLCDDLTALESRRCLSNSISIEPDCRRLDKKFGDYFEKATRYCTKEEYEFSKCSAAEKLIQFPKILFILFIIK